MINEKIQDLIQKAESGKTVYIHELRAIFESLPVNDRADIEAQLLMMDGKNSKVFTLSLPKDPSSNEIKRLASDFLKAEIYNLLSSLGGRSLALFLDTQNKALYSLTQELRVDFGIGMKRSERQGYGRCINVIDRMLDALCPENKEPFLLEIKDLSEKSEVKVFNNPVHAVEGVFSRPVTELENKKILGVDIGGTDIKLALVGEGRILCMKEYDWFPALFKESSQLVNPIVLLTRLMTVWQAVYFGRIKLPEDVQMLLDQAMKQDAEDELMQKACDKVDAYLNKVDYLLDGLGLCFPDVVVNDKVVGGEVYKTRGIRQNGAIDFEKDFLKLTHLNETLGKFCRNPEAVSFTNDGPMAAFTAAVERAASGDDESLKEGFFAHTLGTELGTGWVWEDGSIPDIPLEVYNCIIDLGSYPEQQYSPDDLRSVNNFNTKLPGTLQKYASQSGVFRLAMKYFPEESPSLMDELIEKGFVCIEEGDKGLSYSVPSEDPDMRKPFLEHMMSLLEREGDEVNKRIWFEIGASLGATLVETGRILSPKSRKRILFGRLVKKEACFKAMEEGAKSIVPDIQFEVADSSLAYTPLMKQLEEDEHFTVAQFAQAVGAVYFAVDGMIRKSL